MSSLTSKQQQLLTYLQNYIEKHQIPPSCPEIQSYFGFASLSSVYKHLQVLKDKGFIQIQKNRSGIISLTRAKAKPSIKTYHFPLLGYLNDDGEIESVSKVKKIPYGSSKKFSSNCYLLKVKGGNFLEAGLLHEDMIIIEPRLEAIPTETILANIYGEQLVIKKYQPNGPYVRLDSFCMQVEPLIVLSEEISIHGVVLGVIRNYN